MKKIVIDNGETRFEGEAGINSISFIGHKERGAFSIEAQGINARIDEDGQIICEDLEEYEKEHEMLYKTMNSMKEKYRKSFYMMAMVSFILNIIMIFVNNDIAYIMYAMFLFLWGCALGAGPVGMYFEKLKGNKKVISIMKFHSAEHASINAYYDLHRTPTLSEIRNYSNFSYNCGSLNNMIFPFTFWLLAFARLFTKVWFILFFVILLVSTLYFKERKRLFFMEFLVTSKPGDREYMVAIEGLKAALKEVDDIPEKIDIENPEMIPIAIATIFEEMVNHQFSEEGCIGCPGYDSCKKEAEKKKEA